MAWTPPWSSLWLPLPCIKATWVAFLSFLLTVLCSPCPTISPLLGVLLSGGLDSSLVASVAARHLGQGGVWGRLHSFCVGLAGSPDLAAARKVADFLQTDHHEFTFTVQV